ncbi:MAG: DUF1127 domain-containing protein [Pseudomonadota bacterium]
MHIMKSIQAWRLRRQREKIIRSLSDRILDDVGLNRWDVQSPRKR